MPRLYAAVAEWMAYPSLEYETGHAEALVGEHLSVTNERVEFQRRLTDGEVARIGLKAGRVTTNGQFGLWSLPLESQGPRTL